MTRRYSLPIVLRPGVQESQRLHRWAGARRLVYNLVIQQWHDRRSTRDRHRATSYAGLCREITDLRAAAAFLHAVPVHVLQQAAKDALDAIHRFYKGLSDAPRYLAKRRDSDRFRFPDPKTFTVDAPQRRVKLPKLGWVNARFPRALPDGDRITSLTVVHDGQRWMVQAAVEGPFPAVTVPTVAALGLDLGVTQSLTTSEGTVLTVRDWAPKERQHAARLQRRIARRTRGSNRQRQRRTALARLQSRVADRRRQDQHLATTTLVRQAGTLVIEDLRVSAMTASASGTVAQPGRRVRQKAGLNRAMLGTGFAELRRQLTYKAAWQGRTLLSVSAAYSSQTCARCGHTEARNRETQAIFRCRACGHEANADHNAAQVLLHWGLTAPAAPRTAARVTKARPVRRAAMPASNANPRGRSADAADPGWSP